LKEETVMPFKIPTWLVAAVTAVSLLGPVVNTFAGIVPSTYLNPILAVVSFAGTLHLWLSAPSLAQRAQLAEIARLHADMPGNSVSKAAIGRVLGLLSCLALCVGIAGCTPAEIQAFEQVDEAVLAGLPAVCAIADVVDPTGATIICAIVDAAGNILASEQTTLTTPALAAKYVTAHPAPAAVVPALKARAVKRP
jgi:hypothetical protein